MTVTSRRSFRSLTDVVDMVSTTADDVAVPETHKDDALRRMTSAVFMALHGVVMSFESCRESH